MSKIKIPLDNMRYALHDLLHEHLDELYELSKTCHRGSRSNYDWEDDDEVMWLMQQGVIFPGMEADMANYYNEDDNYDDYEEVNDDGECVWPPTKESHKKHKLDPYGDYWNMIDALEKKKKDKKKHKRGKGKGKAKVIDITTPYSGYEENPTEVDEFDADGIEDGKEIWFYPDYSNKSNRLEFTTLSGFSEFCADQGYNVPKEVGIDITYRRISHTCLDPKLREDGIMQIIAEESYGDMRYAVTPVEELSQ